MINKEKSGRKLTTLKRKWLRMCKTSEKRMNQKCKAKWKANPAE
jgi:hypothetical protein